MRLLNLLLIMKEFLFLTYLFLIEPVFAYENYGDYKKLKFNEYLDKVGFSIIDLVDKSDDPIFYIKENTPSCKSGNYYGYVDPHWDNKAEFVVCTRSIYLYLSKNYDEFIHEINDTVRHEAVHAAQFCKKGDYSLGLDPKRFKGYPERVVNSNSNYRDLPYWEKIMELEAFALEDDPYFVLNSLKNFCF